MRLSTVLASLFGIGFIPLASGTWGSLAALPLAWTLTAMGGAPALALGVAASFLVGLWACDEYVRRTGKDDPSECVIDELSGQWLACLAAPATLLGFAAAFVAFRVFDIWKPWPASAAEKLPGGLGVMADDIVAGAMAAILIAALHAVRLV